MSTELKLLRCIATSEAASAEPPHLPTLMASLGVSPTEFREVLTQLFRKGYVDSEWQTTEAGKRVAMRPLGQVLHRPQTKSHRPGRAGNAKPKPFAGSQPRITTPRLGASVLRANRNTESPVFDQNWAPPKMVEIRQQTPLSLPPYLVRESELEELKPRG